MEAACTSGFATGIDADTGRIAVFRNNIGEQVLALAPGITPDNASVYADVDCFMVAAGINIDNDLYNIDKQKLSRLLAITQDARDACDRGIS